MSLKNEYVRDGSKKVIGTVTTGFSDGSSVVRDSAGHIRGRTSDKYHNTRDSAGRLVSSNSADPGLLIRRK